ncbi:YbjN domain-containing protein [Streptomyces sp. NPDC059637]|uniref:YbjN domain-containing protein n=1 Tax=Streptomyces sp. NPDC059637 TaxID=3347752 RepID=UPI003689CD9A
MGDTATNTGTDTATGTGTGTNTGTGTDTGTDTATGTNADRAAQVVERTLRDAELDFETPKPGHFVVKLPGTKKLSTTCSLVVGAHTLSVNAFVVRRPDENTEAFHRWLLEHNTRLYGVAYAIDRLGDVYLVGRLPLAAVTPEEVDRLLGSVLENADGSFNTLLELGFATSIRKEYEWRTKRGESTRNLEAFTHLTRDLGSPSEDGPGRG